MVPLRLAAGAAALGAVLSAEAPAQANLYLPLDHPASALVEALRTRGHLPGLWSLERPYRASELRAALAEGLPEDLGPVLGSWAESLERALDVLTGDRADGAADPALRAAVLLEASVTAQSSARRELMLADSVSGAYPRVGGRLTLAAGPVIATGRIAFDRRLRDDPEFTGKKDRSLIGRNEEAYVSGHWSHGELFLGRLGRGWGPAAVRGLQLGDLPYGYDHLFARLGGERIRVSALLGRLDDWRYGTDSVASRWFVAHRLALRAGPLELAGTESMLFGGVGRGFELAYANPLTLYDITQYNEDEQGNVNVGIDAALAMGRLGTLAAQGMLDDLQIDDCGPNCEEPPSYGLTVAWEGLALGAHTLFASYTRLTNLAYRTPAPHETYAFRGIGLGHAFTDYDEARAGAELALVPWTVLRPYVAIRRQGEGSFTVPFPAPADYAATPTFLAGTVMRVQRAALAGTAVLGGRISVEGDIGWNRVRNAGHVAGARDSGFEGRVSGTAWLGPIRW